MPDPKAPSPAQPGSDASASRSLGSGSLSSMYLKRKILRAKVTRTCNVIRGDLNADQIGGYLTIFEDLRTEVKALEEIILEKQLTEEDEQSIVAGQDMIMQYDATLALTISNLRGRIESLNLPPVTDRPHNNSNNSEVKHLKLPKVTLPTFSNKKGENFDRFVSQFEDAVNRFNLPSYDKYILFCSNVFGDPKSLVESLASNERSYESARDLLKRAFSSPLKQRYDVLQRLCDLKLTKDADPYKFVSEMRSIRELFATLEIDVDMVIQFFFWRAMNVEFQSHLTAISNQSKPSLAEIDKFIFDAVERYMSGKLKSSASQISSKDSVAMAANVHVKASDKPFKPACTLCSGENSSGVEHMLKNCSKYQSPEEKVARLTAIKACTKCGRSNHVADKCRVKLKYNCSHCGGKHYNFLCSKNANKSAPNSKAGVAGSSSVKSAAASSKAGTSCGLVCMNTGEVHGESILPTFTGILGNDETKARVLVDSGAQSSFIESALAESLQLEVLESDIEVSVRGFNAAKTFQTKTFKLPIKLSEGAVLVVSAVGVPRISTKFHISNLEVIKAAFCSAGVPLADQHLRANVDDVRVVLGADGFSRLNGSFKVLDLHDLKFAYIATPMGAILWGNPTGDSLDGTFSSTTNFSVSSSNLPHLDERISETEESNEIAFEACPREPNLESELEYALPAERLPDDSDISDTNKSIVEYVLNETYRQPDGRLVMPIVFNSKVQHLLGRNYSLARKVLSSQRKKLETSSEKFAMVDEVIKEQESLGIIERITDLDKFLEEHPEASFLAHKAIFKPDKETTKTRVVFLSNLTEKFSGGISYSHNEVILSGPNLSRKLSTAITFLRFNKYLLCFDIRRAFLNIALRERDQNRLLFLWYKNVGKKNFELVAYRNARLSFGLRCSPLILSLALYFILILNTSEDTESIVELKRQLFHYFYVDNGAYSANEVSEIRAAKDNIVKIFAAYRFDLQQFACNAVGLGESSEPVCAPNSNVGLLGMIWDTDSDELCNKPILLDSTADTKRKILQTINSVFDLLNIYGPVLNRARVFLHTLQCNRDLDWDTKLTDDRLREWRVIVKQANSTPKIVIPRCIGGSKDLYRLVAYTDASKFLYGVVIYLEHIETGNLTYVISKTRIISKPMSMRTIPVLELQAVCFGVETITEMLSELSGQACVEKLDISDLILYTDSAVVLCWIKSYVHKMEKMTKRTVFTINRLRKLNQLCEKSPVEFRFIQGTENPADFLTRPVSGNILCSSNFLTGPKNYHYTGSCSEIDDSLSVRVPSPHSEPGPEVPSQVCSHPMTIQIRKETDHLISLDRSSSFHRLVRVQMLVRSFIARLKNKLFDKDSTKYAHLRADTENSYSDVSRLIIQTDQRLEFPEIFAFFEGPDKPKKEIPELVTRLNVYIAEDGILRVKSKFGRWPTKFERYCPVLLSKNSRLTHLIVLDAHKKLNHGGFYTLLSQLRSQYWVLHFFSLVKKVIKACTVCRRLNSRPITINQSHYRDTQLDPPKIPFRYMFIDHFGPYDVKVGNETSKIWVLIFTCLWSRAINLKICKSLSVDDFLRALQIHTYEHGVSELIMSDLGSQLVAGGNLVSSFLDDPNTRAYLQENDVRAPKFSQFPKGCKKLGGLVESAVKLTKKLIYGAVGKKTLAIDDFEFLIAETICLANKRPVAFQESLRSMIDEGQVNVITPEHLLRGRDLVGLHLVPKLQPPVDDDGFDDPTWLPSNDITVDIRNSFSKLQKCRQRLTDLYHKEYLVKLIHQATSERDKYAKHPHVELRPGDLVLIKDDFVKQTSYPMGIVRSVTRNMLDEVTDVIVFKGKTRELLKRHVSSLIFLLRPETAELGKSGVDGDCLPAVEGRVSRARRDPNVSDDDSTSGAGAHPSGPSNRRFSRRLATKRQRV